ncbi:MAG: hypothetical protein ABI193_09595, partial [Minicystis sp.]
IMARRASGEDLKIASVVPDAPPELCRICDKAMAHAPADRFATAAELRAEIEAFLESSKRAGGEEIGKLVRETFAADRQRVLSLVEAQMKVMTAPSSSGETSSPSMPSMPSMPSIAEPAPVSKRDQSEPRDSTLKVTAASAPSLAARPAETPRHRLLLPVGIAAAAALLVFVALRNGASLPAQPLATATASSARSAATVDVWISVDPPEARLTLDEIALSSNPFHAAMPESALARKLRVSAPGFTTDERLITLDRDIHMEMALRAAPAPASASVAAPLQSAPVALGAPRLPGAMLPPVGLGKPTATAAPGPAPGEAIAPTPKKSTRSIDDTF